MDCKECNHLKESVIVEKNFFEWMLVKSDLVNNGVEAIQKYMEVMDIHKEIGVSYKPNLNIGEGIPSNQEVQYRQILLNYLQEIDLKFRKLRQTNADPDNKISEIDGLIETAKNNLQKFIQSKLKQRFDDGTSRMGGYAKKAGVNQTDINKAIATTKDRWNSILRQQLMNIEDILLTLRGRLRQIINIDDVFSYYRNKDENATKKEHLIKETYPADWNQCMIDLHKKNPKLDEDQLREECNMEEETDSAFTNAKNKTDLMGMFGFLESNKAAYLATAIGLMQLVLGLKIVIEWTTCEDNNNCASDNPVCEDCLAAKDGGPYSPDAFPEDQHYGERCNDPMAEPTIIFDLNYETAYA